MAETKEEEVDGGAVASGTEVEEPLGPSDRMQRERQVSLLGLGDYEQLDQTVSLTWKNINYTVGKDENKKVILSDITGFVGPGSVCVILGPSGSGKTSLLSILSGNRVQTSGSIYYQGQPKEVTKSSEDIMGFKGNAAYVAQDDELMGSLTVEETLRYAAQLKISSEKDKETQVNAILEYLGLQKCRGTLVGSVFFKGISGGQKRRLSIGVELVTQPALLFLDEVTSGLDATSAYQLMRVIAKLARLGHSVVMTLHQPTSRLFKLMCENKFYMMILESGHQSYFGMAKDAKDYFGKLGYPVPEATNATDYYLDLVDRDFQRELSSETDGDAKKPSEKNENIVDKINQAFTEKLAPGIMKEVETINETFANKPIVELNGNNFLIQFWVLLKRNFKNHLRNPGVFYIRLVMYAGLCFCLGTLYFDIGTQGKHTQDRISILFFVGAFLTFMSISAMPAFVEERAIYMRERGNNHYGTLAYGVANFVSSVPWIFIIALVCTCLIYGMIQSRLGEEYFGIYLANLFLVLLVAENMMVAISAVSPYFIIGLAMGAGLCGLYMIVCGFFLLPENIPPGWIWVHYAVSFHTYSFQIFMVNEWKDNFDADQGGLFNGNGNDLLTYYDMHNVDVGFNFGVLVIMMIVYRIIFIVLLKLFHRRAR